MAITFRNSYQAAKRSSRFSNIVFNHPPMRRIFTKVRMWWNVFGASHWREDHVFARKCIFTSYMTAVTFNDCSGRVWPSSAASVLARSLVLQGCLLYHPSFSSFCFFKNRLLVNSNCTQRSFQAQPIFVVFLSNWKLISSRQYLIFAASFSVAWIVLVKLRLAVSGCNGRGKFRFKQD